MTPHVAITLSMLAAAGAPGCAPHTTLRQVFDIPWDQKIDKPTLQAAVDRKFSMGMSRSAVDALLPSTTTSGYIYIITPYYSYWKKDYRTDGSIVVESNHEASLIVGRWLIGVWFIFRDDALEEARVFSDSYGL
ncbi:MAG: hypothetical protein HZB38_18865 [Planctomycetes bacterium]|nr:hypothetical protein [Planctomycetota bacterium]